jgi:hypothetical protein
VEGKRFLVQCGSGEWYNVSGFYPRVNAPLLQIGTGIANKNGLQGSLGSGSPLIELNLSLALNYVPHLP